VWGGWLGWVCGVLGGVCGWCGVFSGGGGGGWGFVGLVGGGERGVAGRRAWCLKAPNPGGFQLFNKSHLDKWGGRPVACVRGGGGATWDGVGSGIGEKRRPAAKGSLCSGRAVLGRLYPGTREACAIRGPGEKGCRGSMDAGLKADGTACSQKNVVGLGGMVIWLGGCVLI